MTKIAKLAEGLICKPDKPEFAGLEILHNFTELIDRAAPACIIFKHLIEFLFIIAGDTVRQNINGITEYKVSCLSKNNSSPKNVCTRTDKRLNRIAADASYAEHGYTRFR